MSDNIEGVGYNFMNSSFMFFAKYKDPKHAVRLERVEFRPECDYIAADLGNSYRTFAQYRRQVLFVRPHYFLVLDEVWRSDDGGEECVFTSGK